MFPNENDITPFRIEDVQGNCSNSLISAPKGRILNENSCKTIQIPLSPSKPLSYSQTKTIQEKPKKQRKITLSNEWIFNSCDLEMENQQNILYDISKTPFLYKQIKQKIYGYQSQDNEKNIFSKENIIDLSYVLQKIEDSKLICFYCKNPVLLLYTNVRDPKQWTLERIDNKLGHNKGNVEIACLSCNLNRRTIYHERYIVTQNIIHGVKKLNG